MSTQKQQGFMKTSSVISALCGVAIAVLAPMSQAAVTLEANEYIVFHHQDTLGSTVLATGAEGEVLWQEQNEPYGASLGRKRPTEAQGGKSDESAGPLLDSSDPFNEEEGQSRLGYTGHVRDGATGLTYMQARYYDPVLGRFLSNDPIGYKASNPMTFNRYAYANNNPYAFVDPDGRATVSIGIEGRIGMPYFSAGFSVAPALSFPEPFSDGGKDDLLDFGVVATITGNQPDEPGLGSVGLGAKYGLFAAIDRGDIQDQRGLGFAMGAQVGLKPALTGLGLGVDFHFDRALPNQPLSFSGMAVSVGVGSELHSGFNLGTSFSTRGFFSSIWNGVKSAFSSDSSEKSNSEGKGK